MKEYVKPQMEIVEMEMQQMLATSFSYDDSADGPANARKRDVSPMWDDDEDDVE
ncbi:MAG: hypothetical protein J1E57_03410 [Prevotella sp.]|nr:hypothetical protein [Prevotella sp.]